MARNKNFLDWTEFTTPASGRDLQQNSIRKTLKYDVYQDKTKFKAIALTDMHPLSQEATDIVIQSGYDYDAISSGDRASMKNVRWVFRARILGKDSPHNFIPDPCDTTYIRKKADMARAMSYTQMHTQFITPTDYDFKRGQAIVRQGDVVWVELDKNVAGYNLQMGRFISRVKEEHVSIDRSDNSAALAFYCDNIQDIFNNRDAERVPIGDQGPMATSGTSTPDLEAYERKYAHEEGLGTTAELLAFIASGEGNYNSINAGKSGDRPGGSTAWPKPGPVFGPLTNMTLTALQAHQAKSKGDSTRIFAAGRYQIIPTTLTGILPSTSLTGTDLYSVTNQDILGKALLLGISDARSYLRKTSTDIRAAAIGIARMWASFPHPDTGNSIYAAVGNNSAYHSVEETYQALIRARGKV